MRCVVAVRVSKPEQPLEFYPVHHLPLFQSQYFYHLILIALSKASSLCWLCPETVVMSTDLINKSTILCGFESHT